MKAAVLYGAMDLRVEDVVMPIPGKDEVRVKVSACGVCGSDYPRITKGTAHYFPIILGHEFAGRVDAIGEAVTGFETGDPVVAVPLIPCMECAACKNHQYSLCSNYQFVGTRRNGGYGEYAVLPASNLIKLEADSDVRMAALLEPATVALHGVNRSGIPAKSARNPGSSCVVGGGTIGSFCTQWLRIRGVEIITVIGRNRKRLEVNRRLGAHHVFSTTEEGGMETAVEGALAITGNDGYSYVYETGGTPETVKMAIRMTGRRGTLCLMGCLPGEITFGKSEWEQIARKEIHIVGSWMSGGMPYPGSDWFEAVKRYGEGSLHISDELVGLKLPLSEAEKLPTILREADSPKGRILLLCDE